MVIDLYQCKVKLLLNEFPELFWQRNISIHIVACLHIDAPESSEKTACLPTRNDGKDMRSQSLSLKLQDRISDRANWRTPMW